MLEFEPQRVGLVVLGLMRSMMFETSSKHLGATLKGFLFVIFGVYGTRGLHTLEEGNQRTLNRLFVVKKKKKNCLNQNMS